MSGPGKQFTNDPREFPAWLRERADGHVPEHDIAVYARPGVWLALASAIEDAQEQGRREVAAWAERDQYLQSNVKLVAAVTKLRDALDALRPFPLVVEPVAAALIAEADAALARSPSPSGRAS